MPHTVNKYIHRISKKFLFNSSVVKRLIFWFGYHETINILSALKRPPLYYTIRVNTLKIDCQEVIKYLKERGIDAKQHEIIKEIILIPTKGPNKLPGCDKKVIAYKTAAEGVMRGADLYATGVEKVDNNVRKGDLVEIVDKYGQRVAIGEAAIDADEMLKHKKNRIAVKVIKSLYEIPKFRDQELYLKGLIYQQTVPSALTVHILDPKPNEKILDMCAAPGGKTSYIAQLTNQQASITAVDHSRKKINEMKERLTRLGITKNIRLLVEDSRKLHKILGEAKFDKILLDPPCSALGIRPKLFDGTTEKDILNSVIYQRQFLRSAVKLLKDGGVLVYSTCTLDPEENEKNIEYIINVTHGKLKLEEQTIFIGEKGYPIISEYESLQRFYPHIHDSPGYFIAKLRLKERL